MEKKSDGRTSYKWLDSVIKRLAKGYIDYTDHKKNYFGQLINGGERDLDTGEYSICIHAKFAKLFRAAWSTMDIEQRRSLKNDTAKALHAYYSSHIEPGLHSYETLANIAGIKGINRKSTILKAHKELESIGFLVSWEQNKDGIKINATLTKSQTRSVIRKASKKTIASKNCSKSR